MLMVAAACRCSAPQKKRFDWGWMAAHGAPGCVFVGPDGRTSDDDDFHDPSHLYLHTPDARQEADERSRSTCKPLVCRSSTPESEGWGGVSSRLESSPPRPGVCPFIFAMELPRGRCCPSPRDHPDGLLCKERDRDQSGVPSRVPRRQNAGQAVGACSTRADTRPVRHPPGCHTHTVLHWPSQHLCASYASKKGIQRSTARAARLEQHGILDDGGTVSTHCAQQQQALGMAGPRTSPPQPLPTPTRPPATAARTGTTGQQQEGDPRGSTLSSQAPFPVRPGLVAHT